LNIDATFLPVAVALVKEFATPIVYIRSLGSSYDPSSGEVTENTERLNINAGITTTARLEQGGAAETRELNLWLEHSATGLPHLPTTADFIEYMGTTWKVINITPTYSSNALIASKLLARAS
jgi:hypothetical protein